MILLFSGQFVPCPHAKAHSGHRPVFAISIAHLLSYSIDFGNSLVPKLSRDT
jgi:hypothetical protein